MMDYVQEEGIIKRTGLTNKRDWYLLVVKELIDNAIDWMWEVYQGRDDLKITIEITLTKDGLFKCKISNNNPENIPVFKIANLVNIFDYEKTYGSKQNDFKVKRGAYGDASKLILSMPYVLVNLGRDKSNDFEDKQWPVPMYIRHNGIEQEILLRVDEGNDIIEPHNITPPEKACKLDHTDTEIEITYPIIEGMIPEEPINYVSSGYLQPSSVKNYCLDNIVGTTDISFEVKLIDETVEPVITENIKQPRTHPITDDWNNLTSILRYTPKEFRTKIFGVDDQTTTTIYQILRTFREGSHLKKTPDMDKPISTLVNDTEKVKNLYQMLRNNKLAKNPPQKISLPYSNIRAGKKKKEKEEEVKK